MKTRKLILLLILLITPFALNAQSHNTRPGSWCKLIKTVPGSARDESESSRCLACSKKQEKEDEAKNVERKRRDDIARANDEAKRKALEIKLRKEKLELEEKNRVTEVKLVMPKSNGVNKIIQSKKDLIKGTDKAILVAGSKKFLNESGEVLFENSEWNRTESIKELSFTETSIQNFGIVEIMKDGSQYGYKKSRADVINSKGEYLFNENNIKSLFHINDGWLLISPYNSNNYWIYNLLTKQKISLISIAENSNGGDATAYFIPIFSNNIELNREVSGLVQSSQKIKKNFVSLFPTEFSEAFLSKQSFVLVHASIQTAQLNRDYDSFKRIIDDSINTVLLYCISKDGKLSTVKLK